MRYWRILHVEDQYKDINDDIHNTLFLEIKNLHELDTGQTYPDKEVIVYYIDIFEKCKNNDIWTDQFPLLYQSLSTGWEGLEDLVNEELSPDMCIIDVKLTKHNDPGKSLEKIKEELLGSFPGEAKGDIEKLFSDNEVDNIRESGGFFLMGKIKKLFPNVPVHLYTESPKAFSTSIPFQYSGLFSLSNEIGKNIPWRDYLIQNLKQKIMDGEVSQKKIYEALTSFKTTIHDICGAEIYDNYCSIFKEKEIREVIEDFILYDIGQKEEGWTIGSFFILQLKNLLSVEYKIVSKAIEEIESILSSIDLGKSFGNFINSDTFLAYSHRVSSFTSGPACGLTVKNAAEKNKLKEQTQHWWYEWELNPCCGNKEVHIFEELIHKTIEMGNKLGENEHIEGFWKAKNRIRWRFGDVINFFMDLKKKFPSTSFDIWCKHQDNKLEVNIPPPQLMEKLNITNDPIIGIPSNNLTTDENTNLLTELVYEVIESINDRGYEDPSFKMKKKVIIYLELNNVCPQWIITICQVDGNGFPKEYLRNEKFFKKGRRGGFCLMVNRVKNWIGIEIRSGGIKRNPHIENPGEAGECIYGKNANEFEITYSISD
jgi:hypothetical protein